MGANRDQLDINQIHVLLDEGSTPKTLFDNTVSLEQLYGKMYEGGIVFYPNKV